MFARIHVLWYIFKYVKKYYDAADIYLFPNDDKPMRPEFFRKKYYEALENLKIRRLTPHSTRHTCATLLAAAGADTLAIKQILGHTDYAFTADTYTHTDVDFLKTQMQKVQ